MIFLKNSRSKAKHEFFVGTGNNPYTFIALRKISLHSFFMNENEEFDLEQYHFLDKEPEIYTCILQYAYIKDVVN